ncbi:MAG: amidohydrolase [Prevotella sp.]|nr:amidohydrolase [Prevotella sp.]
MKIIDAHSHLWLRQDTSWDGKPIRSLKNGRSIFLGEEVQMMPPFIIDSQNSAEVFLSNMDYAQVGAAVVVQEFIDGLQNDYLETVQKQCPDRFLCCGMADYRQPGFFAQAQELIEQRGFRGIAIPGHRLRNQGDRSLDTLGTSDHGPVPLISDEMMRMFHLMEQKNVVLSITLEDGDRQVGELREVISECPGLRIAIGHLGMANPPQTPCWENPSWRRQMALAQHAHVMIEMGGITWLYNAEFYPFPSAIRAIREAIDIAGADKLMWGSDYPRTITAITYRMSYDFILKSSELSDADKRLILGENALRFYGFTALPELPYIKNMSE